MATCNFRIHPSVGFARVGNSPDFLIAPETPAGMPVDGISTGGLPILPGTGSDTIKASDLRDSEGRLKRQAARFRIFAYPQQTTETYPSNTAAEEIRIGSVIDGKTVSDIVWTVHLANKKANWYTVPDAEGIDAYLATRSPAHPPIRNTKPGAGISDAQRLRQLVIDPGPRAVGGRNAAAVCFDRQTPASYGDGARLCTIDDYPKSFPADHVAHIYYPQEPLTTLGELRTDAQGRLIATGGYGRTAAYLQEPADPASPPRPLDHYTDNDGWFDDSGDGPVSACLVFADGSSAPVNGSAWLVVSDPAFAPQVINSVTLWDDIFDIWVRHLALMPALFKDGEYQAAFQPSFAGHIRPIFRSAASHQWIANINAIGNRAHRQVDALGGEVPPSGHNVLGGLSSIRDPHLNDPAGAGKMPMSLGDAGHALLSLRKTQYFFLNQWLAKQVTDAVPDLNEGEQLDRISLFNCQGGRMSPGIDVSFCCRDPAVWITDWQTSGTGPFRICTKPLDYSTAGQTGGRAFLTAGYVPSILHNPLDDTQPVDAQQHHAGLEPGDLSKFMALPWHTDYNSCATHPADDKSKTLYWSWPAQRPVAVYVADDVTDPKVLPAQKYSVRGSGADSTNPDQRGRFDPATPIVKKWQDIGIVIQATAIDDGREYAPDSYLEVQSRLEDDSDPVPPWSWPGGAG